MKFRKKSCSSVCSFGILSYALGNCLALQSGLVVQIQGPEESYEDEHLSYEEILRQVGLFSLEERRLEEDLIVTFLYLEGVYWAAGEGPFMRECSDRTRAKGFLSHLNLKEENHEGGLSLAQVDSHPWGCLRPGRMGLGATSSRGWDPCLWQRVGSGSSLRSLLFYLDTSESR